MVTSLVLSLTTCVTVDSVDDSVTESPVLEENVIPHKPIREVRAFDDALRHAKKPQPESPMVKVGMLLPLSGRYAELGHNLRDVASQAIFDHRAENLTLLFGDTGGHSAGVITATRTLLDEGVHVILGPLFGSEAEAIKSMTHTANVTMVTFSNDIRLRDEMTYVFGLSPVPQIDHVIAYILSQDEDVTSEETLSEDVTNEETLSEDVTSEETLSEDVTNEETLSEDVTNEPIPITTNEELPLVEKKPKRFAILVPQSTYGKTIIQAVSEAVTRHEGIVVRTATYLREPNNIRTAVRKVLNISLEELRERRTKENTQQQQTTLQRIITQVDEIDEIEELQEIEEVEGVGGVARKDEALRPLTVDFDVLILADGLVWRLDVIFESFQELGIDRDSYLVIGTSLWERVGTNDISALAGSLFAAPPPDRWETFRESFRTYYGYQPPRQATLIYDAVHLAARFADYSAIHGRIDLTKLTHIPEISGLDGLISLEPQGIVERDLTIYEITGDGLRIIDTQSEDPEDMREDPEDMREDPEDIL